MSCTTVTSTILEHSRAIFHSYTNLESGTARIDQSHIQPSMAEPEENIVGTHTSSDFLKSVFSASYNIQERVMYSYYLAQHATVELCP